MSELSSLAGLFERVGVSYAVIGAHAVNAWIEPRATADLDVTIFAGPAEQQRLRNEFEAAGYSVARVDGAALPSGPDFVRFVAPGRSLTVELQAAKTELQREVVSRAKRSESGLRVATPEDLIVLKLIAYRPKDRLDLAGLARLNGLDWKYVERWAVEWQVEDRLVEIRRTLQP
jgi:hypothetical protein